jgi:dienelactone hydrolase
MRSRMSCSHMVDHGVFALALFAGWFSLAPVAAAAPASDADGRGPFAVGFTSFTEDDGRELGGIVFRHQVPDPTRPNEPPGPRPVPMMVFYPVDPADAAGFRPAEYPRNPFLGATPFYSSTAFEANGVDAALQDPPPSAAGPFPLLVQGAGLPAPYWVNVGLATRLASHGFVVVLLAHYGEAAYAPSARSDPSTLGTNTALQRGLNRLYDVQLAIDVMLARSAADGDAFQGLVDPARLAIGGHSIGGLTSIQLAGGDANLCDTYPNAVGIAPCVAGAAAVPAPIRESRVRALLLLDPSVQLAHWDELHAIGVPAMLIGEDFDSLEANTAFPGWLAGWAHQAFSGHPSYLVSVAHSAHNPSFTSACAAARVRGNASQFSALHCDDPTLTPYQATNELVWRYAVAFLKTELAGEPGYQAMLTPGWAVSNEPFATLYVNEKKNGLEPPAPYGNITFVHTEQPDPLYEQTPVWADE